MNELQLNPYQDTFSRNVAISLSIHGALIVLLLFKAAFFPAEIIDLRNAIRVDVVGLPDKVSEVVPPSPAAAEKPSSSVSQKATPTPPPKPTVALKKDSAKQDAKEAQRKALEKLKALQAIENMQKEMAQKSDGKAPPKPQTYRGNALSSGDSLSGLERIEFDRYFSSLEQAVKANWRLPGWLSQAQLRAQALVLIDEAGQIIKRQIVTSSGNEVFDGQVLEAIDRAAPFPQPPARLKDVIGLRGIVFNFPE